MSLQNKVNKTFRDLFNTANDQIDVAIVTAKQTGRITISDEDLATVCNVVKQTLDATFIRGCTTLEKLIDDKR